MQSPVDQDPVFNRDRDRAEYFSRRVRQNIFNQRLLKLFQSRSGKIFFLWRIHYRVLPPSSHREIRYSMTTLQWGAPIFPWSGHEPGLNPIEAISASVCPPTESDRQGFEKKQHQHFSKRSFLRQISDLMLIKRPEISTCRNDAMADRFRKQSTVSGNGPLGGCFDRSRTPPPSVHHPTPLSSIVTVPRNLRRKISHVRLETGTGNGGVGRCTCVLSGPAVRADPRDL